jgi:DNA replication and repair protein RecF
MRLRRILLKNFRNLREVELLPDEGYNLLLGANAAGKTNLCEAIYYAARGELLKGERQRELIRWGERWTLIELAIDQDLLRITLDGDERTKRVEINGKPERPGRLSEYLRVVAFTADDLQIIKGRPSGRRRILNSMLAELDLEYKFQWRRYEQVLRGKNLLLRQGQPDRELLAVYQQKLIKLGALLIARRLAYLRQMNEELRALHKRLEVGRGPLQLEYISSVPQLPEDEGELEGWLAAAVEARAEEERQRGFSIVGPHRDDLRFVSGGIDLGQFGSQGEQRLAIIQLKLGQLELHCQRFDQYPILILDDLLSELDSQRGQLLLEALPSGIQAFLTATELRPPLQELGCRIYLVEDGRVKEGL